VRLERADTNFPALVAHPVFRPVKLKEDGSISNAGEAGVISNGAFSLARSEAQRVLLERADNYWARDEVTLQHVEFVGQKDAESALAAYRAGEVDAVSNAAFEPLAIKLLTPYKDFHRTTYGAITYYSFNTAHAPFDDVRVREALAIAIDRDRISQDEMGGSTEPAKRFLPEAMASSDEPVVGKSDMLEKDSQRARELMAEAGFPGGKAFPKVRLLINRNEQQRAVSQAVAGMWREVLNVETEIIIKNWDDYEAAIHTGDYDVVRRGIVMQTTDESTNMQALFRKDSEDLAQTEAAKSSDSKHSLRTGGTEKIASERGSIDSEEKALSMLSAMPIYFASSYALVKPYVVGFESNVLDAPSLKAVRINTTWRQDSGVVSQHMAGKRWH
jgi:oligopeptide transport system substrate-binding protein